MPPKTPLTLRATFAIARPQLLDELFKVKNKKLLCRLCGKEAILRIEWKDNLLCSGTFGFCDCPKSEERRKFGVIKAVEVVESP